MATRKSRAASPVVTATEATVIAREAAVEGVIAAGTAAPDLAPLVAALQAQLDEARLEIAAVTASRDQFEAVAKKHANTVKGFRALHTTDKAEPFKEAQRLYDGYVDLDEKFRPVLASVAAFAAHFHEAGNVYSRDAGTWVPGNLMANAQKFILKDFAYMLTMKLHYNAEQVGRAVDKVAEVERTATDDEIGLQELDRAVSWLERARSEGIAITTALQAVEVVFEQLTGEKFERPGPREVKKAPRPQNAAQLNRAEIIARAKAAGAKLPEQSSRPYTPTHDGVDAAQ